MIRNDEELRAFYSAETPVSHPRDALLLDWTTRISAGERGAEIDGIARYIIKDFQLRQFLGVPQSPVTLDWLAESLSKLVEYADPAEALGLMPRPSKRPANPQHGWDISYWVEAAMKRGYKKAEAIQVAAEVFHTDESNVRKLHKKRPEWMNPNDQTWDEYFQLRSRPLPPIKTGNK